MLFIHNQDELLDGYSSHITIHKSKGKEYKNVFIVGDDTMKEFY